MFWAAVKSLFSNPAEAVSRLFFSEHLGAILARIKEKRQVQ